MYLWFGIPSVLNDVIYWPVTVNCCNIPFAPHKELTRGNYTTHPKCLLTIVDHAQLHWIPSIISLWSCVIFKFFSPLVLLRVPIYNKGNFNVFRCFIFYLGTLQTAHLVTLLCLFSSNFESKIFLSPPWLINAPNMQWNTNAPDQYNGNIFCLNSITWNLSSDCKILIK